ncbi:MAG TPA: AI-2E family transporter [Patescibacteria group bacterium]|nr:AI-2E family transporter [Patescibacteria group bacterium]
MNYRRLQVYFFLTVFALSLVMSFLVFRPYLGLMVFAGVLAVLMLPVYRRLKRYYRGNETLAALSAVFLALVLILIPMAFIAGTLVAEAVQIFNSVRGQVDFGDVASTLAKILGPEQANAVASEVTRAVRDVATYAQPFVSGLTANIVALFSNTFSFVLGFFIMLMGMYYLLKDGAVFKRQLLDLSPLTDEDDSTIFDRVIDAIKAVAYGQFVVSIIKGVLGGVAFLALGLPTPVFWGTMIALTNFIPAIGTALVTAPFIVYLFATGQLARGIVLSAISILVIGLVDNFLTPQVMKSRIRIHPMLILLSMLGGLSFFGPMGIFFGPIALSVTMAMIDIYKKEFRKSVEKIGEL